jgi:hypothetical protein
MPENEGFYQKYKVERVDGKPITGPTFTLELDHDSYAIYALQAYREVCFLSGQYPLLVDGLDALLERCRKEFRG